MHSAHRTPAVRVTTRALRDIETDLLVIPVFEDDSLGDLGGLDTATGGEFGRARTRGEFKAHAYDVFSTPAAGWKASRIAVVGLGSRRDITPDRLRRLAATAGLTARQRQMTRVAIAHHAASGILPEQAAQVLAEGVVL